LAVILVYRYIDVGAVGPIPQMYEPVWFHDKSVAAVAESVATVAALGRLLLTGKRPAARASVSQS
jgi:hypothetical protein